MTSGERTLFAVAFDAELARQAADDMETNLLVAASIAAGAVHGLRAAHRAAQESTADVADDTRAMLADMVSIGGDR